MIFLGFVGGTILSVPLAFAADAFGSGYRSAREVELDTGLPVLAHVPKVKSGGGKGEDLVSFIVNKPDSVFTKSIRLLCARLLVSAAYNPHQSIVFVSSEAGEGKTTVTIAVARALARSGRKVVVVDADFRCGKVAALLGLRSDPGLSELIAGAARLEDVIQRDPQTGVDVITSGAYASESADDLSREPFTLAIQDLRSGYDVVLIDAPPFLALSSASILTAKADASIVVAAWSATSREVLKYTVEQIQRSAPCVADPRRHASAHVGLAEISGVGNLDHCLLRQEDSEAEEKSAIVAVQHEDAIADSERGLHCGRESTARTRRRLHSVPEANA